ncbi:MAG: hypothetical protein LBU25_01465 [Treponema sp.]|nr:hypothetical protein [Treponema sp.]
MAPEKGEKALSPSRQGQAGSPWQGTRKQPSIASLENRAWNSKKLMVRS